MAVQSTYSTVGGIWEFGFRHDPRRPLESIAEQMLTENLTNRSLVARYAQIKRYVEEWEADALIIHSIKSCRLFSAGQGDMRDYFTRELGVPTLMVESDLEDPRYYADREAALDRRDASVRIDAQERILLLLELVEVDRRIVCLPNADKANATRERELADERQVAALLSSSAYGYGLRRHLVTRTRTV